MFIFFDQSTNLQVEVIIFTLVDLVLFWIAEDAEERNLLRLILENVWQSLCFAFWIGGRGTDNRLWCVHCTALRSAFSNSDAENIRIDI